jgi:hypothetical protein
MELEPYWGQAIPQKHLRPAARELGIETRFGWPHVSAHLLDAFEKRGYRVQGDAGTATALHAIDHTCQTESTSPCHVVNPVF